MHRLILLCLLLYHGAHAQELRIVGNDYSVPKIYAAADGQPAGMLVDILRYVDAALPEHSFTLDLFPWARAYSMAENGQAGIVGLSWTAERQKNFDYSEPLFYDEVLVIVRQDKQFAFSSIDDLKGLRIGLGVGGTFGEEFEQARQHGVFSVDEDNGPVTRLKKLLAGRIDAALINPGLAGLHRTIAQDPELQRRAAEMLALPQPLKRDANHLGFHKSMAMGGFLVEFNEVIRRGYESGDIPRLLARYQQP